MTLTQDWLDLMSVIRSAMTIPLLGLLVYAYTLKRLQCCRPLIGALLFYHGLTFTNTIIRNFIDFDLGTQIVAWVGTPALLIVLIAVVKISIEKGD